MVPKEFGTGTREFPFLGWYQKNLIPKYRYRHTLCTTGSNLWWVFLNGTYWYKEKDLFQHIWVCYRAIALLYTSEYLHIDLNGNSKFPDLSSTHLILTLPRFVRCKEGCQVIRVGKSRVRSMPSSVALQAMTLEPRERNFCSPGGDLSTARGDVPVVEVKYHIRNSYIENPLNQQLLWLAHHDDKKFWVNDLTTRLDENCFTDREGGTHDRNSQTLWLKVNPRGHTLFVLHIVSISMHIVHCTIAMCVKNRTPKSSIIS